jgi:hypothetical protein
MKLTCGCTAAAPRYTSRQVFAAQGRYSLRDGLMLTCPTGHGLVDVVPVADLPAPELADAVAYDTATDPWAIA